MAGILDDNLTRWKIAKNLKTVASALAEIASVLDDREKHAPEYGLSVSVRLSKVLDGLDVKTTEELAAISSDDLGRFKNIGKLTIDEAREYLAESGLTFINEKKEN